ncbi:MAG: hypothetical protein A3K65_02405 [Euryarchaeota archaeon RBG_16_68_12]|nr:MAG: hypothetical protein A3K65_02405 [Euryarchaeota archaeon RBG_16_68_12]
MSSLRVLRTFAIVGAAAFVLSALAVAVAAADDDGVPDDMEARTARNVVAHGAVDSFFIRSKSVGATQDDVFEVDYSDGRFTVSYARTAGEADTVWYRLEFKRISEVRGDGGQIEVVQKIDIPSSYAVEEWRNTTRDGEPQIGFTASTLGGVFRVRIGATERFAQVDGGLVSPTEVKVDLEIRGWQWRADDSRLRLDIEVVPSGGVPRVENESDDVEHGWASDESQVNVTSGHDTAYFSWARTAVVDGVSKPVQSTPLDVNGEGYEMSLLYERGNVIRHDPKMGVISAAFWSIWNRTVPTALQADLALYAVGIALVAGVVGGTAVAVRRRRKGGP